MATANTEWKMPEPPSSGAVSTYFFDGGEVFLGWCDPGTGEPAGGPEDHDIVWPFMEERIGYKELTRDLVSLGFQDLEDLPLEG